LAKCKDCEEEIEWIKNMADKWVPLNMGSKSMMVKGDDGEWRVMFGRQVHWETCSSSDYFRKQKYK
jgi:hypothetical protein